MSRALWFAAGAGASVYAMLRARRAAEILTADGLRDRWQALGAGARVFREELLAGRAEAEAGLRERLLPTYDPTPELSSTHASAADRPGEVPPIDPHQIEKGQQ